MRRRSPISLRHRSMLRPSWRAVEILPRTRRPRCSTSSCTWRRRRRETTWPRTPVRPTYDNLPPMARGDKQEASLPRNLDFTELQAFLAVIAERSFSRAATKMHRTQSAVSYAVRRLEMKVGERLFHRSSNSGALTEAGEVLRQYAERLVHLADEAQLSVRELRDLRRGRVLIGANEASIAMLLPLIAEFRREYQEILIDVRRVHARHIAAEVVQGNLEFGVTTFQPSERRLRAVPLGSDELVAL